jgi:2Fe-2S ferredoxin
MLNTMPKFIFVAADGARIEQEAPIGTSAMFAALTHGIDGIVGECGGSLACGTCHVYVDPSRVGELPPPGESELEMLTMTACPALANSRLSCQILASDRIDALVLRLPEKQ